MSEIKPSMSVTDGSTSVEQFGIQINAINNINELMDNVYNFIMSLIRDFEIMIDSIELPDYLRNIQIDDQTINDQIVINDTKLIGSLYDIYYDFLVKEQNKTLNDFTIGPYEYPNSFTINHQNFTMHVVLKNDKIVSSIVINNKIIENPFDDYVDGYKSHISFDSIYCELINIRDNFKFQY